MDNNKNDFQVYGLSVVDKDTRGYVHWAEGLTLYIIKDGVYFYEILVKTF